MENGATCALFYASGGWWLGKQRRIQDMLHVKNSGKGGSYHGDWKRWSTDFQTGSH